MKSRLFGQIKQIVIARHIQSPRCVSGQKSVDERERERVGRKIEKKRPRPKVIREITFCTLTYHYVLSIFSVMGRYCHDSQLVWLLPFTTHYW